MIIPERALPFTLKREPTGFLINFEGDSLGSVVDGSGYYLRRLDRYGVEPLERLEERCLGCRLLSRSLLLDLDLDLRRLSPRRSSLYSLRCILYNFHMSFGKAKRDLNENINYNPPPGYYTTNSFKQEEDLQANFPREPRFHVLKKNTDAPGPGHYGNIKNTKKRTG